LAGTRKRPHLWKEAPRIAVVDLDIHFGDGTAWIFYQDPSVFHLSIHLDQSDDQCFPFLVGKPEERGSGLGIGRTLNLPLAAKAKDVDAWLMFKTCGLSRLLEFSPEMIFLSCGFDGMDGDPTKADCKLTPAFYATIATECESLCPGKVKPLELLPYCSPCCAGRIPKPDPDLPITKVVATLQGGYQAAQVAEASLAVINALDPHRETDSRAVLDAPPPPGWVAATESKIASKGNWWGVRRSFDHGCE